MDGIWHDEGSEMPAFMRVPADVKRPSFYRDVSTSNMKMVKNESIADMDERRKGQRFQGLSNLRQLEGIFLKYDTNANMHITEDELKAMITELTGEQPSPREVHDMMQSVDKDGNGTLELEEFISIYKLAKAGKIKYQALAQAFVKFDDLLQSVKVKVVEWSQVNPGRLLGEGATAVVYSSALQEQVQGQGEAEGTSELLSLPSKRKFAVKLLKGDATRNDFAHELDILSHLSHPNIYHVHALGEKDGRPFAVLDLVETDLARALGLSTGSGQGHGGGTSRINAVHPPQKRLRMMVELASALAYLHDGLSHAGVVLMHRDLKPENVGLQSGVVKLLDFGLAVGLHDPGQLTVGAVAASSSSSSSSSSSAASFAPREDSPPASPRTRGDSAKQLGLQRSSSNNSSKLHGQQLRYELTGDTGSPRWMAPEVHRGMAYNCAADVYSFSLVLWAVMSLRLPYEGFTLKRLREEVCRDHHTRPLVPPAWHPDLAACLADGWAPMMISRPRIQELDARLFALAASIADGSSSPLSLTGRGEAGCCTVA